MSFGAVTAIIRPGATITASIVGPRGNTGLDGLSITGPAPLTAIAPWQTLQSYVVGPPASFVSIGGSSYACVIAHTSTTFAADLASKFWAVVASIGPTGARGSLWFEGSGVPGATTGAIGDYWFQTDTCDIFMKGVSGWGSPVANIKGAKGDTGPAGRTIQSGTGVPSSGLGTDGDFYIDTAAVRLYGPKASGAWPATSTSLVGSGNGNVNPSGAFAVGDLVVAQTTDGKVIQSGGTPGNAAYKNVGSAAGTVAAGDDPRIAGALQSARALSEVAALGPLVQAAVRQNIGALSRGRVLALAIAN